MSSSTQNRLIDRALKEISKGKLSIVVNAGGTCKDIYKDSNSGILGLDIIEDFDFSLIELIIKRTKSLVQAATEVHGKNTSSQDDPILIVIVLNECQIERAYRVLTQAEYFGYRGVVLLEQVNYSLCLGNGTTY